MSNEELARRIQGGEEDLIPQLWEQVEPFVSWKARHYIKVFEIRGGVLSFETDDLIQESYFAMLRAVDYFNPDRGGFLHILELQCRYAFAVVAGLRGTGKRSDAMFGAISANIPLADDCDNTLLDITPDTKETIESAVINPMYQQQLHEALERALSGLSAQQETILRRRYYQGETQAEVARELKCSATNVEHREHDALRHLYCARSLNGLAEFLETHTNYYSNSSFGHFKSTGMSVVEATVIRREQLARQWLSKNGGRK